jgi:hypothetical protein
VRCDQSRPVDPLDGSGRFMECVASTFYAARLGSCTVILQDQAFEREAIMDWQAWRKALELYVNTPELIYASIFVAIAIFGFTWWLRSHISKERIAALQERLRLGKEGQEHIKNELDSLKQNVSLQETIINDLRSTGGVPRTQVELLNSANATVVSALADLEQANTNLGETLSLAGTG